MESEIAKKQKQLRIFFRLWNVQDTQTYYNSGQISFSLFDAKTIALVHILNIFGELLRLKGMALVIAAV